MAIFGFSKQIFSAKNQLYLFKNDFLLRLFDLGYNSFLINLYFEALYFLKLCLIFVGSLQNLGDRYKKVKMWDWLVIKVGLSVECGTWNSNLEGTLLKYIPHIFFVRFKHVAPISPPQIAQFARGFGCNTYSVTE